MYIFELITKLFKKTQVITKEFTPDNIIENSEECRHVFMPLDSSNEFFFFFFCGLVVPKNKLK